MTITEDATTPAVVTGTGINRVVGSLYNITPWYLTLPVDADGDGNVDTVNQPTLSSFTDQYLQLDSLGRMVFTAPVNGATTSAESGATRSEFREQEGGANANWSMSSTAFRQLTVSGYWDPTNITGSGGLKQMIIGQIHGTSGTPPLYIAIDYDHSPSRMRLFVNGPGFGDPLTSITAGTLMTYRIKVSGGQVSFYCCVGGVANLPATPYYTAAASSFSDNTGNYLKFGAYNKTAITATANGSAVSTIVFYELIQGGVTYTGTAPNGSPITTAAFSPPSNSLLVAMLGGGTGNSGAMDTTISDTSGRTWTRIAQAQGTNPGGRGVAAVYCTYLSSAPGSIQVTGAVSNLSGGRHLAVKVLNGASATQSATTGATRVVATSPAPDNTGGQITMTTTAVGSMVYGISDDWDNNDSFTPISGTTTINSFSDTADIVRIAAWKSSAATSSPASATFGGTLGANSGCNVAAFEVLPFGVGSGGSATLVGSGALLATGVLGQAPATVLQGTGVLAAVGTTSRPTSAVLAGEGDLSTSGAVGSGSVTMNGSGQLVLTPIALLFLGAVLQGQGVVSPSMDLLSPIGVTLGGIGRVEIDDDPLEIVPASTTLTGQGVMTVGAPLALTVITATLTGQGVLGSITAVPIDLATITLGGSGLVEADAVRAALGTALLTGRGKLLAAAVRTPQATVHLGGLGALHSGIHRRTFPTASLAGRGVLVSIANARIINSAVAMHGAGALAAAAFQRKALLAMLLRGSGRLIDHADRFRMGHILLTGSGRVKLLGPAQSGMASLNGSGHLTASAITGFTGALRQAAAALFGHGRLWAQRFEITNVSTTLAGEGLLALDADTFLVTPIPLVGQGHLSASTYTPAFPTPIPPQFTTAPFSVLHEPVHVAFNVIPRS